MYEHTSKVLPSDLAGVCKTCGTPLSISCTRCDWTVSAGLSSHHEVSGHDVTVKEEAEEGSDDDNGDNNQDQAQHSLDVSSTSHVVGAADNEGQTGPAEERRDVMGGAREQRSNDLQELGLQWNTDGAEEFQGTKKTDSSRIPAHELGRGFPSTIVDERGFPLGDFMDVKPDISDSIHDHSEYNNTGSHEEYQGNCDDKCNCGTNVHGDPDEEYQGNCDDKCNCGTNVHGDPDDDETVDICEESQDLVKSKGKPDRTLEDDAEIIEEQKSCLCDVEDGRKEEGGEVGKKEKVLLAGQGSSLDGSEDSQVCFVVDPNDGTGEALSQEDKDHTETGLWAHGVGRMAALSDNDTSSQHNLEEDEVASTCHEPYKDHGQATPAETDEQYEKAADGDAQLAAEQNKNMFELAVRAKDEERSKLLVQGFRNDPQRDLQVKDAEQGDLQVKDAEQGAVLEDNQPVWICALDHENDSVVGEVSALDSRHDFPSHWQTNVSEGAEVVMNLQSQLCLQDDVTDEAGVASTHGDQNFARTCSVDNTSDRADPQSQSVQRGLQHHVSEQTTEAWVADAADPSPQCLPSLLDSTLLAQRCHLDHGYPVPSSAISSVIRMSESSASGAPVRSSDEKPLKCDVCSKSFSNYGNFKTHKLIHRGDQFICDVCGKVFPAEFCLKKHIKTVHVDEKPVKCDKCGVIVRTEPYLRKHRKHCGNPKHYMCDTCGKFFGREQSLKHHSLTHSDQNWLVCDEYAKSCSTKNDSHLRHIRKDGFMCEKCGKTFNKRSSLSRHSRTHDPAHRQLFKCDICDKAFSNRSTAQSHKKIHSDHKPYICETCGYGFRVLALLEKHQMAIHDGLRPYQCSMCKKSFTKARVLKAHMNMHFGVKPYDCNMCTKSFATNFSMKTHKVTVHQVPCLKTYSCEVCGRIYPLRTMLKNHMGVHTGEKTERVRNRTEHHRGPPYPCDTCGRTFSLYGNLRRHRVTRTGEKPFQCDVCLKCFTTSTSAKTHKVIHSGIRPFECDICQKTFKDRGTLGKHKKIHRRQTSACDP